VAGHEGAAVHHPCDDEPIPVRIVPTERYDSTPEGRIRLQFDTWVYGIMIVLTIVGNVLY
jgi:hypothetical protein